MRSALRHVTLLVFAVLVSFRATAVPTTLSAVTDLPTCDVLSAPLSVDELGPGPNFPVAERIFTPTGSGSTASSTCPLVVDNPLVPNLIVSIQNVSGNSF